MPTPALRSVAVARQKPAAGGLSGALSRRLIVLAVIPLGLLAVAAFILARGLMLLQASEHAQSVLNSHAAAADRLGVQLSADLRSIAEQPDFGTLLALGFRAERTSTNFPNTRAAVLGTFDGLNSEGETAAFSDFLLLRPDGTVWMSTEPNWEGISLTGTPALDALITTRPATLTSDFSPLLPGGITLVTALEIRTDTGTLLGYIAGFAESELIAPVLSEVATMLPGAHAYLVIAPDSFVALDRQTGTLASLLVTGQEKSRVLHAVSGLASSATAESALAKYSAGKNRPAEAHVGWAPSLNAGLVASYEQAAMVAGIEQFRYALAIFAAGALALMAVLIAITARLSTTSLRGLAADSQRFAEGDLTARLPAARRKDEVGIVARALNTMADQVTQLRRSLEDRVQDYGWQARSPATFSTSVQQSEPPRLGEVDRLYASAQHLAGASDEQTLFERLAAALREAPYASVLMAVAGRRLEILALSDEANVIGRTIELPRYSASDVEDLERFFREGPVVMEIGAIGAPQPLQRIAEHLTLTDTAWLPVRSGDELAAVILLGTKAHAIAEGSMTPYAALAQLSSELLTKLRLARDLASRLGETQTLRTVGLAVSSVTDLGEFFRVLHAHVKEIIGDYDFLVALYDEKPGTINVPYSIENGKPLEIEPFPIGEGLTSILIRSREPLYLVEDTERRAVALGVKVVGRMARSWMGAPMVVQDRVIGALIIQDAENERAFTQDHLNFFTALGVQVAGVINTARLLDESRQRALRLETAAEISRDIGSALDVKQLLAKAVTLTRERFEFYHSAVFLLDPTGQYAVVREATGEAGEQMKRSGHQLAVGSRSIVGTATSTGQPLVVNDTARSPIYFPNPLLPGTRSEAAIPLRVGDRILGALDVQSDQPQAFTEDNLRILQILADQLAVAVVNTELFAQTQDQMARQRLLHEVTMAAASGATLDEALRGTVTRLREAMGGDRVAILLANEERTELRVHAAVGYGDNVYDLAIPFGGGVTGLAAANRQTVRVDNVQEEPRYIEASVLIRSELAVPLLYRDDALGVLNVESEKPAAYSASDEQTMGILARSIAAIIANARLLDEMRTRADRERLLYEITGKIRRSADVQTIVETTAEELRRVAGTRQARVEVMTRPRPAADETGT